MYFATISGSMSVAEYARNIGTNANMKYNTPPSTDAVPAMRSVRDDVTR